MIPFNQLRMKESHMARLLHAMSTAAFSPVIVAIRTGTRVCGRDQQSQFMATGPSSSSSPSLEKEKKTFQLLSRSLQRNNAAHLNTFFFLPTKTKKDILFSSREKVPWNHSKPQWRAASNSTCYAPPAAHDTRGSISILSMPNTTTTTTERTREWYGKRKNPKDSLWIVEYNSSPVISQSRNLNKESTTATCTTEEVNRSQRHFVA